MSKMLTRVTLSEHVFRAHRFLGLYWTSDRVTQMALALHVDYYLACAMRLKLNTKI